MGTDTMYDFSFTHDVVTYTHIFYIYLIKRINIHTCVCVCVLMVRDFWNSSPARSLQVCNSGVVKIYLHDVLLEVECLSLVRKFH